MKRPLLGLALLTVSVAALRAGDAQAQVSVYFGAPTDTAFGAVPGVVMQIPIRAKNAWWTGSPYSGYPYITAANVTFAYDAAKIQILGVDIVPGGLTTIVSTTPGSGTFGISATGSVYGTDQPLYLLRVKLATGVTDGTYLWVKGDSATVQNSSATSLKTPTLGAIGQVCHATQMWGDVDGNFQVDSRDALIALSAAVGLPIPNGFSMALGDVDGDGLVTSRDALFMLSYAIGLPTPGTRDGTGLADACPGLTAPGDTVAFFRNDPTAGLYHLGASSVAPAAIPGATSVAGAGEGRLASDGRTVVYECPGRGGQQICRVDADTGGVVPLTSDTMTTNSSPDWSPAGDSIVYLRNGQIWKMAANGSGQGFVPGPGNGINGVNEVKWGRVRTQLAYANGALHVTAGDGTSDVTVTTTGITSGIDGLRWSPAGDSLVFMVNGDQRLWVVPVAGGTPVTTLGFAGTLTGGDWGSQGVIFSLDPGNGKPPSLWVVRGLSGPVYRVTQPTTYDQSPSWRRSP